MARVHTVKKILSTCDTICEQYLQFGFLLYYTRSKMLYQTCTIRGRQKELNVQCFLCRTKHRILVESLLQETAEVLSKTDSQEVQFTSPLEDVNFEWIFQSQELVRGARKVLHY